MNIGARLTASFRAGRAGMRDWVMLALIVIGALLLGSLTPAFRAEEWTLWVIYGLLALSFTFIWGHGGIFSFGQAGLFGIGGYAYSITATDLSTHTNETITAVIVAVLAAALAAGLLGYFIFYGNVGDVAVAIITLATSLVLLTIMSGTAGPQYHIGSAQLGGYNGMVNVPPLTVGLPGGTPTPLSYGQMLTVFVVLSGAIAVGVRVLLRRPFGRVVAALRVNEFRTQLLGYDVRRYKLITFMIGGAIAGLAGAGYAAWGTFINPSVFSLQQAAFVAIWVLLGGRTSLLGAFLGVILFEEVTSVLGGSGGTSTPIVLGLILIAVVLLLPAGIVPTAQRILARIKASRGAEPAPPPAAALRAAATLRISASADREGVNGSRPWLCATELSKRFGGVRALSSVSAKFQARGVRCLIGPNGAGKSTFFNLLVGRYRPSAGDVTLGGSRITRWRPDQRARHGIGIKLQVPSLYGELTTHENVWLAAYARYRKVAEADARAREILEGLGLLERAADPAAELSHGQQQWLEIGMVIAAEPSVILLDEPTAGMTRDEARQTVELVKLLGQHAAVIVVEHDMEFVRALGAQVTVFHQGSVFAEGNIAELRRDERILDIYLGRPVDAQAR